MSTDLQYGANRWNKLSVLKGFKKRVLKPIRMNYSLCSRPGEKILVMSMEDVEELSSQDPDADGDVEQTGLIILNYNKIDGIQSKLG